MGGARDGGGHASLRCIAARPIYARDRCIALGGAAPRVRRAADGARARWKESRAVDHRASRAHAESSPDAEGFTVMLRVLCSLLIVAATSCSAPTESCAPPANIT